MGWLGEWKRDLGGSLRGSYTRGRFSYEGQRKKGEKNYGKTYF